MTIKRSTGLNNHMMTTGSFKAAMDGGYLRIYAGPVPATADDAITGATLLCTVSNNATATGLTFNGTASGGAISKTTAEVWRGVNSATGTASFWRLSATADAGAASTTEPRLQGTVGTVGNDLNLSSVALTSTVSQSIDSFNVGLPA